MAELETPQTNEATAQAVATNTFWGAGGRFIGGLFAIAALAILSRAMGPQTYGDYATALAFFYVFSAIADLGIYQILVRDLGKPGQDEPKTIGTAVTIRIIALVVSLAAGLLIFWLVPKYTEIRGLAPLAAAVYLPLSLGQVLMAVFQKHLAVKYAAIVEFVARGLQVAGVYWLAETAIKEAEPFLLVLLTTTVIQLILLGVWTKKLTPVRFGIYGGRHMLKEALPVGLSLIFTLIYFRMDTVLLSLFQQSEAVGIYNLAYKVLEQLIFLPAMFIGVMTPILTKMYSENPKRFKKMTQEATKMITLTILPIVTGGLFLREHIITLLGGDAYTAAAQPLAPLLLGTALIYAGTLLGALVVITNRQHRALWVYGSAMVISVLLNIIFIPKYSYMGAAWTTVITEAGVITGLYMVLRGSGASFLVPHKKRITFALLVMTMPLLAVPATTTALGPIPTLILFLVLCPPLYGGALIRLGVLRKKDIKTLLRPQT